jgi:hypothetical protein
MDDRDQVNVRPAVDTSASGSLGDAMPMETNPNIDQLKPAQAQISFPHQ